MAGLYSRLQDCSNSRDESGIHQVHVYPSYRRYYLYYVGNISDHTLLQMRIALKALFVAKPRSRLFNRCKGNYVDWMNRLHCIFLLKDLLLRWSLKDMSLRMHPCKCVFHRIRRELCRQDKLVSVLGRTKASQGIARVICIRMPAGSISEVLSSSSHVSTHFPGLSRRPPPFD